MEPACPQPAVLNEGHNVYQQRAHHVLDQYQKRRVKEIRSNLPIDINNENFDLNFLRSALNIPLERYRNVTPDRPVCIIGAGMAGLYAAMILQSLKIPFEILESSNRVGGRIFTHHFGERRADSRACADNTYDYFDVGAMRYPKTDFMERTFDLINNKVKGVKFIKYHFDDEQAKKTYKFYNNNRVQGQNPGGDDPWNVQQYVPDYYRSGNDIQSLYNRAVQPFRQLFVDHPFDKAMKMMVREADDWTLRSYMAIVMRVPHSAINYCETLNNSTRAWDRALVEEILDSLAFDWPLKEGNKPIEWYCIDKGSHELTKAMMRAIDNFDRHIRLQHAVTKIDAIPDPSGITVTCSVRKVSPEGDGKHGSSSPTVTVQFEKCYSAVISTMTLSRLSLIDMAGCDLHRNYAQWSAIRELQYGPSIKIGLRFSEPWWQNLEEGKVNLVGGQSSTDLPIRTTVYPSYPEGDQKSCVMIASYCWTQDADRLGSLMHGDGTAEPELLELVFRDLAKLHNVEVAYLKSMYTEGDYFAWDWNGNPDTMGAFALFGPGQFRDLYPQMIMPAARERLFFAGEALSSCHAWVAGSFDSSYRAVEQLLITHQYPQNYLDQFHRDWPESHLWGEEKGGQTIPIGMPGPGLPEGQPRTDNPPGIPTIGAGPFNERGKALTYMEAHIKLALMAEYERQVGTQRY